MIKEHLISVLLAILILLTYFIVADWYWIVKNLNQILLFDSESNDLLNHQSYKSLLMWTWTGLITAFGFVIFSRLGVRIWVKILFISFAIYWLFNIAKTILAIGLIG